jgi:alpha-ketoglutarate-dependent taurine dioxygenase
VFREMHLTDEEQLQFAKTIGEVVPLGEEGVSKISLDPTVSDTADYTRGAFFWHIDGANDLVPQKATLLAAKEIAEEGGDTEFADTYRAYADLPEEEKAALAEIRVIHSFAATQLLVTPDPTPKQREGWARVPSREHPVVWTRPDGRRSLLIGATTEAIVGQSPEAGRQLLDRLLDWCTQPQYIHRHQWHIGDLVVWDNTGMLHRALPYDPTSRRLLHRTTLVGELAVA